MGEGIGALKGLPQPHRGSDEILLWFKSLSFDSLDL